MRTVAFHRMGACERRYPFQSHAAKDPRLVDHTRQFNQWYCFLYITEPYFLINLSTVEMPSTELTQNRAS